MMEKILGLTRDDYKEEKKMSVYANQWRSRSIRGIVHNNFFYYTTGSLDTNEYDT